MATNQEAYSLEMSLISKNAIINAWEKHHHDKTAESIERLKKDGELQVSVFISCILGHNGCNKNLSLWKI